jgi:hypothetical protein
MCLWFLERVDRSVTWRGITAPAYRFWHPVDHISFLRHGRFDVGDRWHITEAFGAHRRFLLDQTFYVARLGETGFTMEIRKLVHHLAAVDERWGPTPEGLVWTVEMTMGSRRPVEPAVTRRIIARRMGFLTRWRRHNVEEAGCLPQFLPELYAQEVA